MRICLMLLLSILIVGMYADFVICRVPYNETHTDAGIDLHSADALILEENVTVHLQADCSYKQKICRKVRILTEKGRKTYASEAFSYLLGQSSVEILDASVIKPNGARKSFDPSLITDLPISGEEKSSPLFETFRVKTIRYPHLDTQDILESTVIYRVQGMLKNHYSDMFLFQYTNPILFKRVELLAPKSLSIHHVVLNGALDFTKSEEGPEIRYTWTGENLPGIMPESGMVGLPSIAARLITSTLSNYEELSRYGFTVDKGKVDTNKSLHDKTRELTAGRRDIHSKIFSLFRFVSGEIEYLDGSLNMDPFREPRKATTILEKGFATCREKNILFMAMLKKIGVDADDTFVTFSTSPSMQVPSVFFHRAVTRVHLPDGNVVFMDPSLGLSTSFGESYIGDRYVLSLTENGNSLEKVSACSSSRSKGTICAGSIIDENGNLSSDIRIQGTGYYDFTIRTAAVQYPGLKFARFWQRLAAALHEETTVEQFQFPSARDLAVPFHISFKFRSPTYWTKAGSYTLFKIPVSSNIFDIFTLGLPGLTSLDERRYPLFFLSTIQIVQDETIQIPPGYTVTALPESFQLHLGALRILVENRVEEGRIIFHSEFALEKSVLEPSDYDDLKKIMDRWAGYQKSYVILQEPEEGVNLP